ncbi:MAG TPA: DNA-directed RNA polymerase subunit omega [Stellaceae bacterium]|nr:DNA-directed RNA polymerase subunit omega [Stellaceae bacterium]
MARVTVEDCILKIPNRFELVLLAAQRARDVASGAPITLERDNDKNPVVALREIADETIGIEQVKNSLIKGMQKHVEIDEPEEDKELDAETQQSWPVDQPLAEGEGEELAEEAAEDEELSEDELYVAEDGTTPPEAAEDVPGEAVEGDVEPPPEEQ